jgi:uncharacterized protein
MNHPLLAYRQERDRFFRIHPQSPVLPEKRDKFTGLTYYDYNADLVFDLTPEEFANKDDFKMQTSTGDVRYYQRWGKIKFDVEDQPAELTLFWSPGSDQFFIPFTDATSGSETYGAGRYLDLHRDPGGKLEVDFNRAYNPYCAYSIRWNCPIPPAENRLKVPIRAGEKTPEGDWVEGYE